MLFACRAGDDVEVRGRVTLSGGPVGQELRVRASILEADGQAKVLAEADVDEQGTYRLELDQPYVRVILEAVNNGGGTRASALLDSTEPAPGQDVRTAPPMTPETALEADVYTQMVRDGTAPGIVDTVDLRLRLTASRAQAVRKSGDIQGALRTLGVAVRAAQQARLRSYAKPDFEYVTRAELLGAPREAVAALDLALDSGTPSPEKAYADFFVARDAALPMHSALEHQKAERDAGMVFRAIAKAACIGDDCQFDPSLAEIHATGAAVHFVLQQAGASELQPTADAAALELLSKLLESPANTTQAWTRYRASIVDAEDSVLYRLLEDTGVGRPTLSQVAQASRLSGATLGLVMLELILKDGSGSSPEAITQSVDRAFANYTVELTGAAAPNLQAAGASAKPALTLMLITQEAARP
ncbi:hypothetical protein [Corallococcus sp. 4LFB]|uniref:hypothetical protein n=1 Tax=Corallococcus sp. 4LFB TaxID=3383249 RepID=UPI00397477C0